MKVNNNIASQKNVSSVEKTKEAPAIKHNKPDTEKVETAAINKSEFDKKIESVNKFLESAKADLKFQFHEGLNEYYITIVNSETSEVIKEIPPRKFLDMYATMMESIGFLVDHRI